MIKTSINLPRKRRLDISLVKSREQSGKKPLVPSLGQIRRIRKGNKLSRFFRYIFEHEKIKKIFGANIGFLIIASTLLPQNNFDYSKDFQTVNSQTPVFKTEKGVRYPTNYVRVTQGYKFFHPGIDFDGITGDPVFPISKGFVEAVSYSPYAYGNAILINHGQNLTSLYAHLSKIEVSIKQEVDINTKIGEIGTSGRAYGDHLHLEVREDQIPINPFTLLR